MRRIINSILLYLISISILQAQPDEIKLPQHEFFLKINPLAVIEADAGIGIIGEYRWPQKKIAIQLEIQPIFFSPYGNLFVISRPDNTIENSQPMGIEIRPEIKYYHSLRKKADKTLLFYTSVDLLYKHVDTKRLGTFTIFNGGTSSFNQVAAYSDIKNVFGIDVKFGWLINSGNNSKWYVEPYVGFGIRSKTYKFKHIPIGAAEPTRDMFLNNGNTVFGISLPASLRLAYRF